MATASISTNTTALSIRNGEARRPANHTGNNVVSFGQARVVRETPTYLRGGRI